MKGDFGGDEGVLKAIDEREQYRISRFDWEDDIHYQAKSVSQGRVIWGDNLDLQDRYG